MSEIISIKPFKRTKLNNNEYAYFSTQFLALMTSATAMALHVPQSLVDAYAANVDKLTDMVSQSRIADETALIADVDKRADDLIVYFFDALRSEKKSPIASKRDAATGLYNALKPYVGCQRLPQRQQVQSMRGMLTWLSPMWSRRSAMSRMSMAPCSSNARSRKRPTIWGRLKISVWRWMASTITSRRWLSLSAWPSRAMP